jgi:hypothetical protein
MSASGSDGEHPPTMRLEPAVALLALGFFLLLAFQAVELIREGSAIRQIRAAQEQNVQEGLRLRAQLNAVAGKTAALADAGDANAKAIIDEMRKLGISVKPTP